MHFSYVEEVSQKKNTRNKHGGVPYGFLLARVPTRSPRAQPNDIII